MANGIYKITEDFEKALGNYTSAPYVVTVDNMSNALFLALATFEEWSELAEPGCRDHTDHAVYHGYKELHKLG